MNDHRKKEIPILILSLSFSSLHSIFSVCCWLFLLFPKIAIQSYRSLIWIFMRPFCFFFKKSFLTWKVLSYLTPTVRYRYWIFLVFQFDIKLLLQYDTYVKPSTYIQERRKILKKNLRCKYRTVNIITYVLRYYFLHLASHFPFPELTVGNPK